MTSVAENVVNDRSLRENLIHNAIEFLQEPRVVKSSDERKRKFLKTKGMTDEEIDEAYKRAGQIPLSEFRTQDQSQPPTNAGPLVTVSPPAGPTIVQVPWKSIALVLLTFSEVGRLLFYIIKKCLYKFILKPRKSKHEKKSQAIQEDIKSHVKSISTRISEQSKDLLTSLKILKKHCGRI